MALLWLRADTRNSAFLDSGFQQTVIVQLFAPGLHKSRSQPSCPHKPDQISRTPFWPATNKKAPSTQPPAKIASYIFFGALGRRGGGFSTGSTRLLRCDPRSPSQAETGGLALRLAGPVRLRQRWPAILGAPGRRPARLAAAIAVQSVTPPRPLRRRHVSFPLLGRCPTFGPFVGVKLFVGVGPGGNRR